MKPAEARRLAQAYSVAELGTAAEALSDEQEPPFDIGGADHGEKLTHVLLATRIRQRVDAGEEFKEAYRAVMGEVRGVLMNDPG